MTFPALLLASNSPRRRQLLGLTRLSFRVQPTDVDESPRQGEPPDDYVRRLAEGKACAVVPLAIPGELILAADTVVADGDVLLGKPDSAEQAADMLKKLRGRVHRVFTALAVLDPETDRLTTDLCEARVPMRTYSQDEIEAYVASGDPLDKAGAYAIQHRGFHPVEDFSDCYACVMGLALCHLVRTLRLFSVEPSVDVPLACQSHLDYACPVSSGILASPSVPHPTASVMAQS
jgi:septum formation protein